jgi:myo-inositol-1(or 4)-monophosphatase
VANDHLNTYQVGSKSFTAVAVNIASKAGEWIKSKVGQANRISSKTSASDLVTEVDKGAESLIRKLIHTYFPTHAILGEEGAEPGPEGAMKALEEVGEDEYVWIVDPIDGTTNFIHGLPFFSVSIALAHRGEVIVGVIYDPSRDEMFVAEKGKGAYVHGKRIEVSGEERLADCLLATGFPTDREAVLPLNMRQLTSVINSVRNVRNAGSAALHLAYVASGRLSGFWEMNLNAWDLAAGILLVQEAGGRVSDISGEPYQLAVRNIVATNGRIHDALIAELKKVN